MAAKWTFRQCWWAVMAATHALDVAAVSRDQYRAWRASQPDPLRWPALNSMDRVAEDYGEVFFHASSAQGKGPDAVMVWSRRTCVDSFEQSGADTIVGYKTWRVVQEDPTAHPAWSIIDRHVGGWSKLQEEVPPALMPSEGHS